MVEDMKKTLEDMVEAKEVEEDTEVKEGEEAGEEEFS